MLLLRVHIDNYQNDCQCFSTTLQSIETFCKEKKKGGRIKKKCVDLKIHSSSLMLLLLQP